MDFFDINYLKHGNATQQRAYPVIMEAGIMQKLSAYTPVLAGTIPIGIDIEGSDLDILCCYDDSEIFASYLTQTFSGCNGFSIRISEINGIESIIANFYIDGFEIEVFGQNIPVTQQYGYRHMVIEHQILEEKGEGFRQKVIALKQQGLKTEPAFAQLLGLEGNPYEALLDYKMH
jgi:hypothetical protein